MYCALLGELVVRKLYLDVTRHIIWPLEHVGEHLAVPLHRDDFCHRRHTKAADHRAAQESEHGV